MKIIPILMGVCVGFTVPVSGSTAVDQCISVLSAQNKPWQPQTLIEARQQMIRTLSGAAIQQARVRADLEIEKRNQELRQHLLRERGVGCKLAYLGVHIMGRCLMLGFRSLHYIWVVGAAAYQLVESDQMFEWISPNGDSFGKWLGNSAALVNHAYRVHVFSHWLANRFEQREGHLAP